MAADVTKIKDETTRQAVYELDTAKAPLASPTLVTPTLGVATATSINKVAITAPATSATLTIANGKTLTASNTITLASTDGAVATIPAGTTSLAPLTSPSFTTPALGVATGTSLALTGNLSTSAGYIQNAVGNALTAAGTDRATSLALTKGINNVTTADASTGVTLPSVATAGIGSIVYIFNAGASAIQVYGAGSDTIDGVAAATGVPLTNAKRCMYIAVAAATWISAQLEVVSA